MPHWADGSTTLSVAKSRANHPVQAQSQNDHHTQLHERPVPCAVLLSRTFRLSSALGAV
ncbi:hypothetical protein GMOD_00008789 [Pyrenophora seminiperda CCB06]|uniref:Uncharacterized protein n=1 Tax=Pyrenophora seminiperda CCB06 TaxID=1302712 RepID=A0A3M7M5S8_9PLEO|nr:hypothetical protein GMOD_00008789 [Pyrenophora seminiperda CCB06]